MKNTLKDATRHMGKVALGLALIASTSSCIHKTLKNDKENKKATKVTVTQKEVQKKPEKNLHIKFEKKQNKETTQQNTSKVKKETPPKSINKVKNSPINEMSNFVNEKKFPDEKTKEEFNKAWEEIFFNKNPQNKFITEIYKKSFYEIFKNKDIDDTSKRNLLIYVINPTPDLKKELSPIAAIIASQLNAGISQQLIQEIEKEGKVLTPKNKLIAKNIQKLNSDEEETTITENTEDNSLAKIKNFLDTQEAVIFSPEEKKLLNDAWKQTFEQGNELELKYKKEMLKDRMERKELNEYDKTLLFTAYMSGDDKYNKQIKKWSEGKINTEETGLRMILENMYDEVKGNIELAKADKELAKADKELAKADKELAESKKKSTILDKDIKKEKEELKKEKEELKKEKEELKKEKEELKKEKEELELAKLLEKITKK